MARMNPSGDATLSLKCSDELIAEIDAAAEDSDHASRSAYIRSELAASVDDDSIEPEPTETELTDQLDKALGILKKNAGTSGKIPTEDAQVLLSTQLGVPKQSIKRLVLTPLESHGHIEPHWGNIEVRL